MPGRSVRRSLRAASPSALTAAGAPALSRRGANEVEKILIIVTCRHFRCSHVRIGSIGCALSREQGGSQQQTHGNPNIHLHNTCASLGIPALLQRLPSSLEKI